MQIILALVVGAAIGTGIHFLVGERARRGVAVGTIIGAAAASVAWAILTWTGIGTDSIWLWLSMLVAPVIVTYPVLIILARTRVAHDERQRQDLGIA